MITPFYEPILNTPIANLNMSSDFALMCEAGGFCSISDLLGYHTSELMKMPGFSCHLLGEYVGFLEDNDLAHYLDND